MHRFTKLYRSGKPRRGEIVINRKRGKAQPTTFPFVSRQKVIGVANTTPQSHARHNGCAERCFPSESAIYKNSYIKLTL